MIQDVFWHLFTQLPKWSGGVLYSWIKRTATNFLISRSRSFAAEERRRGGIHIQAIDKVEPADSSTPDPARAAELREAIQAFRDQLTPEEKILLELILTRKSDGEIIDELDCSRRSYFERKRKLVLKLRDLL